MLVIGYGVNPGRERNLPGFFGDVLDSSQGVDAEHTTVFGRDHKQDVVVLVEGVLHLFKCK